ncbi:NAD-dependent epimerase/dehydratase family protein [Mariniphaga sediminis]|uniref:NAD-dependent epimerase/dehydratase family protein n=1 Tax=Mariniphaga sediminis TaxID=1628158 RepID=UPI00356B61AA
MNNLQRNIWIFGATGFIGQALFEHLAANTPHRLFLLLHRKTLFRKYEGYNTFMGSLSDFDDSLFERYPPDVIFHLARFSGSNTLTRRLASLKGAKANQRLVEVLKRLDKPPVVVYVSGSLMYGSQKEGTFATEDFPLTPTAYAEYYIRGELPWIQAQEKGTLDIRFARPGWIVGSSSWFREFFWNYYLKTGNVPYYGDGSQLMSVVSLPDCARLIARLAAKGAQRQNLNIFSMAPLSQKMFSEMLAGKLNAATVRIPKQDLLRRYGKTVASALTSSTPLATLYPEWYEDFQPLTPDLETVFDDVLAHLKNK